MSHRPKSIRFINGIIYRDANELSPADTLVTQGGLVRFVGARDQAPTADITIDLGGMVAMPGLTDAHIHLYAIANERLQIRFDPSSVSSIGTLLERTASAAADTSSRDSWIRGAGFDENGVKEHRYPTREELDAAAPNNPVVIRRFCGHTAILNSVALKLLAIDETSSDPVGGQFERDVSGRLNGVVKESAADEVFRRMPRPDRSVVTSSLRSTIADAIRLGLTGAVEAAVGFTSGFDEEYATWGLLRVDPSLPRLGFMYRLDPREARGKGLTPCLSPDWQTNTLKFFADGIVGARTAAVSTPFCDTGGQGFFMRDEEDLDQAIVEAHLDGWQVAVHAVGDRAVSRVIAAYEMAQKAKRRPDARHRIEHYFCPPVGGLSRMKEIGAIVVSQPSFLSVMHRSAMGAFGPDVHSKYPARSVIEAGVTYVASSDAPTGTFSPWFGMASAVDRGADMGKPLGVRETLSRQLAVHSYIHGGAYAMGHEAWRGSLKPGMAADLIVVDRDPFDPSVDLRKLNVLKTMIRGAIAHDVARDHGPPSAKLSR